MVSWGFGDVPVNYWPIGDQFWFTIAQVISAGRQCPILCNHFIFSAPAYRQVPAVFRGLRRFLVTAKRSSSQMLTTMLAMTRIAYKDQCINDFGKVDGITSTTPMKQHPRNGY